MWEVGPGIHQDPAARRPQAVVALPEATEGPKTKNDFKLLLQKLQMLGGMFKQSAQKVKSVKHSEREH